MKYLISVLMLAMIVKDVKFINDPFWLRGITQVSMLMIGISLLLTKFNINVVRRQWLVLIYICMLVASIFYSPFKTYTLLQVGSFLSALIFFLGVSLYVEKRKDEYINTLTTGIIIAYSCTSLCSLLLYVINPSVTMLHIWGDEIRFSGVFAEPGIMGVTAGLLVGLAIIKPMNIFIKIFIVIIGLICVYLTLSRTFMIALVVALFSTSWIYFPRYRKWYGLSGVIVLMVLFCLSAFQFSLSSEKKKEIESISRADSITNLSGRTSFWVTVLEERSKDPLVGEGFTMGGLLLLHKKNAFLSYDGIDPRLIGRTTLHSGYIQALADLAYPGFLIYALIILLSVLKPLFKDVQRKHAIFFYSALYMLISNSCESMIYSAANFPSIYFWFVVILFNSYLLKRKPVKSLVSQ